MNWFPIAVEGSRASIVYSGPDAAPAAEQIRFRRALQEVYPPSEAPRVRVEVLWREASRAWRIVGATSAVSPPGELIRALAEELRRRRLPVERLEECS